LASTVSRLKDKPLKNEAVIVNKEARKIQTFERSKCEGIITFIVAENYRSCFYK
jgi:hypothetical protein